MNFNITKTCRSAFFTFRRIRKYLSIESALKLMHAFSTSRLGYCNSLLCFFLWPSLINISSECCIGGSSFTGQQWYYSHTNVWSKMAEGKPKAAFIELINLKFIWALQSVRKYFGPVKVRATKTPCHMAYSLYEHEKGGQVQGRRWEFKWTSALDEKIGAKARPPSIARLPSTQFA